MKNKKFRCSSCKKTKSNKPYVKLNNVAWDNPNLFCSWDCFMNWVKDYLKAIGYKIKKSRK